jgi:glycosyltransferase involved in cell wall biosynthesis
MKFIYWFAYHHCGSPSVRYRGKFPLEWAKEHYGTGFYLVVPGYSPKQLIVFIKAYFSALLFREQDSVIVIQRVRSGFIYSTALKVLVKFRRKGTIYDLDDADYLEHPPSTIHYFARNCHGVSAGSNAIKSYMQVINPHTHFITSPVIDLQIVKSARNEVFTVGWIGDYRSGHKEGLWRFLFPAIEELPVPVRLVLIGVSFKEDIEYIQARFASSPSMVVEIPTVHSWEDEQWIQERIAEFDVGVATLLNTPVQLAKSGIKAKQYMNNGVPVLTNDLPENNTVVVDGVNGFFFHGSADLTRRLTHIRSMDDAEYTRLSKNARASVVGFDHHKYYKQMSDLVSSISAGDANGHVGS